MAQSSFSWTYTIICYKQGMLEKLQYFLNYFCG